MLTLLLLLGCQQPVESAAPRSVTFLHINDTYRIEGVPEGGGMARVRQLRKTLEIVDDELVFTHGGDLLNPSMLSRRYRGEQMVDVLNHLDGTADFDPRMVVTLGNHEFDNAACKDAAELLKRIEESQFTWVSSNITFKRCTLDEGGSSPAITSDHLVPHTIVEANGLRIGMFGLTIDTKLPKYVASFGDPVDVAKQKTAELRALTGEEAVDLVVAVTHLSVTEDKAILDTLGPDGPDLILGGHEHIRQSRQSGSRWVLKADAEAVSAVVAQVTVSPEGVTTTYETVSLTGEEDEALTARIQSWLTRHDEEVCEELDRDAGCLTAPLVTAAVDVIAEELEIRKFETNVGDWVADLMLEEMKDEGAQLAFINAGALRINRNVPLKTDLDLTFVEELVPYDETVMLIELTGAQLKAFLQYAGSAWHGAGRWLQVAGVAFSILPSIDKDIKPSVDKLTLLTGDKPRSIRDEETLRVATVQYLATKKIHQALGLEKDLRVKAKGRSLKTLVVEDLERRRDDNRSFDVELQGRICNLNDERARPCLALD